MKGQTGFNETETTTKFLPCGKNVVLDRVDHYKWEKPDEPGELLWVDKNLLRIDVETYQREKVSEQKVRNIEKNFDWHKFGVLTVARRSDGTLWVVEGGHRTRAVLRRSDIIKIPCIIFSDLKSSSEEANVWADMSLSRSIIGSFDRHRAWVVAGDEAALRAAKTLEDNSYFPSKGVVKWGFSALGQLNRMIKKDPDLAVKIFSFFAEVALGDQITSDMLSGMGYLCKHIADDQPILTKEWQRKLTRYGSEGIQAKIYQEKTIQKEGGPRTCAYALLALINDRMRIKIKLL